MTWSTSFEKDFELNHAIDLVKEGQGHYPLAPEDPAPIVDLITQAAM